MNRKYNTASELEYYIARYFDFRQNLIVPNIWWGMGLNHECDLFILTKSGFAYEVEIKTTKADLKRDQKKGHCHGSKFLKRLYFGIPELLSPYIDLIPENAGILVLKPGKYGAEVEKVREAKPNPNAIKLTPEKRLKLAELGTLRTWSLRKSWLDFDYSREQEPWWKDLI